jgi:lipoprotein-anchoring transpeptidase ErfK/SrfK
MKQRTFSRFPRDRQTTHHSRRLIGLVIIAAAILLCGGGATTYALAQSNQTVVRIPVKHGTTDKAKPVPKPVVAVETPKPVAATPPAPKPTGPCAANTLAKLIIVSISSRHLWACESSSQVYDSPVVTGMENLAADLTPTGTYHIYSKQTNLDLVGSDSTGSWNDHVSYWMPFLNNKYGTYGFHDATWRPDSDFGNIDPYSDKGSHGCVELPLATAGWLYNWAPVNTTLTIES